jgi:hypothetical protein
VPRGFRTKCAHVRECRRMAVSATPPPHTHTHTRARTRTHTRTPKLEVQALLRCAALCYAMQAFGELALSQFPFRQASVRHATPYPLGYAYVL